MVEAIVYETGTVVEGIFYEFGLEINEKTHPFKN
jgi:hypothetical protein